LTGLKTGNFNRLFKLCLTQLKHEIRRKPLDISFNSLYQGSRLYLVKFSQVRTEHYFLTPQEIDAILDSLTWHQTFHLSIKEALAGFTPDY